MSRKSKRSLKEKFALKNSSVKEALSEFLGTFLLIALGCGSVGQAVLSRGAHGGPMTITIGFATAVIIAVYVTGGISGGHLNPAVSLAMSVTGRLKWTKLPIYILAQLLGAFVGAAAVFGIYYDAFMQYSNGTLEVTGPNATAHIFATYPAPYLSLINGFADQVMSTAVLLLAVFAIFDTRNNSVPKGLEPIAIGLLIIVLTCSLGMNSGCAMNPARDLGPRLFTAVAGWGMEVFTAGNNWWWVPIVAPMLGGVLGAMVYIVFIEIHHSDTQTEENDVHDKYELTNME
ncbi:aquaporin-9 isoform X1 [Colius striatus]|uniref:aquaporin-9 isoform X1 n=1 Tax=Colius striatus TaxID=57412 RepID=UPI002B1E8DCD|nr:aquaporin-9 isoform X1 [Colius striatus]